MAPGPAPATAESAPALPQSVGGEPGEQDEAGIAVRAEQRQGSRAVPLRQPYHLAGILVDCVVVAEPEMHRMNYGVMYDAALAGEIRMRSAVR